MSDAVCTCCQGRDTIIDPLSGDEEPYVCPDCGGSGRAADQIPRDVREIVVNYVGSGDE